MIKKWSAGLFLICLFLSASFARNTSDRNRTNWEVLEVSSPQGRSFDGFSRYYRSYNYLMSGISFRASESLEWLRESGWEPFSIAVTESSYNYLYFRRPYIKERTDKEIERLKKEFNDFELKPPDAKLIDLDRVEAEQKLADFNRAEEAKLRTALERVKDLPLKIISVSSRTSNVNQTNVGAEIVIDATAVLLKDGNKYRSSDADKYSRECLRQIFDSLGVIYDRDDFEKYYRSNAAAISKGTFKPKIGGFYGLGNGISIKSSVVVKSGNRQIIVAMGVLGGKWKPNPQ